MRNYNFKYYLLHTQRTHKCGNAHRSTKIPEQTTGGAVLVKESVPILTLQSCAALFTIIVVFYKNEPSVQTK